MSQYLILAENITYKNNKLSCINIYDKLSTIAMPAEFKFDLAFICGPNWKVGEHKLTIKARANNGKKVDIGDLTVNIINKDYVYNVYANDIKLVMDYSVSDITIVVYDNKRAIFIRKYPIVSMLIPNESKDQPEDILEVKKADKKSDKKSRKKKD